MSRKLLAIKALSFDLELASIAAQRLPTDVIAARTAVPPESRARTPRCDRSQSPYSPELASIARLLAGGERGRRGVWLRSRASCSPNGRELRLDSGPGFHTPSCGLTRNARTTTAAILQGYDAAAALNAAYLATPALTVGGFGNTARSILVERSRRTIRARSASE